MTTPARSIAAAAAGRTPASGPAPGSQARGEAALSRGLLQARRRELHERPRAMRERGAAAAPVDAVLLLGRHLAEGPVETVGSEHRVVAEALRAARRPHQRAVDAALEQLVVPVRPGDDKRRHEMGAAHLWRGGAAPGELAPD